ncbi:MAG TPA: antibiotic biosynthesis monooxygenase [Flavobacteriales bacterium]
METVCVRYRVPDAQQFAFLLAMSHALKQLDRIDPCLGYDLSLALDDPELFLLRVEWRKGARRRLLRSSFLPDVVIDGWPFPEMIEEHQRFKPTGITKHRH